MTAVCPEIHPIELSSVGSPRSIVVSPGSELPSHCSSGEGGDSSDDDRYFEHSDGTGLVVLDDSLIMRRLDGISRGAEQLRPLLLMHGISFGLLQVPV